MNFQQIADQFRWGSEGFAIAVETHLGFCISRNEIKRIAIYTTSPDEFQHVWENEGWWTDSADEELRAIARAERLSYSLRVTEL